MFLRSHVVPVVAALIFLVACGREPNGGRTADPEDTVEVRITPSESSIAAGQSTTLNAEVLINGEAPSQPATVTWKISDEGIATLSATGPQAQVTGVKPGTATVTATSGSTSMTATVTVTEAALTAITLTPSPATVAAGLVQQLTATAMYSDGSAADVTAQASWSSSNATIARVEDTEGNKGKVTGLLIGSTTLSASIGDITGSVAFTVSAPLVESITVTPGGATLPQGRFQQLIATAALSDGTTSVITSSVMWSSADSAIAEVTSSGQVRAKTIGAVDITATQGAISGSATVQVTAATVNFISVTPSPTSFAKGTTRQLTAIANLSDGTLINMTGQATWTSSDTAIATVSSAGLVTGVAEGTATITAAAAGNQGNGTVTVLPPEVVTLVLAPLGPTVAKGLTQQFNATATFTDGTTSDVSAQATWSSANPSVATVGTTGLATANLVGSASITATLGTSSTSTVMTVTQATVSSITLTPAAPSIAKGLTQAFVATATYSDNTTGDVTGSATWASSDTAIATVTTGGANRGVATGTGEGTATITATVGTVSGTAALTVTPPTLVSIAVTPVNPSIATGLTRQFTATATYTDASTTDVTTQATWVSSDETIATISVNGGLALGKASGTTTITATVGTTSNGTTLTVTAPALTSVDVTPVTATAAKGRTQQFVATGSYSNGTTADVTAQANWASSDTNTATVGNGAADKGLATAVAVGTATLTATIGTFSGTATFNVGPAEMTSISVAPAVITILPTDTLQFTATAHYTDNSVSDVTSTATWSSTNTAAATVSSGGLASGVSDGTTMISATSGALSGQSTLNVSSTAPTLSSITVSPSTASVAKGLKQTFTATGTYSDMSQADLTTLVTWSSNDSLIATINNAAPNQGVASAVAVGTATLTATLGSTSGAATLNVTAAEVVSLAVTPSSPAILQGDTQQFVATATYTDGTAADITTTATWTATPTTVAQIGTNTGLATGTGGGDATITATVGSGASERSASQTLNVTSTGPTVTQVTVTPVNPALATGSALQLRATATYSDATTADVTSTATWASATPAVVSVTASGGLLETLGAGTSSVTATVSGITGSTNVTVTSALCNVVINEVQAGTAANANDEWFELYNPCSADIDLNGRAVAYRSSSGTTDIALVNFTATKVMPSRTFVVYTHAQTTNVPNRDGVYTNTGAALSASAGGIALRQSPTSGAIIDAVAWGTATNAFREGASTAPAPSNTQTIIRYPFDGKDSNVSSADWQVTSSPTPRASNP